MLHLSGPQLRLGIRAPDQLVRLLRDLALHPIPPDTPRSAQRPGIEASLRVYFEGTRDGAALLREFAERTSKWKRRDTATAEIANATKMLEQFAEWDKSQPEPESVFHKAVGADVLGHEITMGHALVHTLPSGAVLLRQLLTDDTHGRSEDRRLYATASLLHFQAVNPTRPVERVDVWHLRFGSRLSWPDSLLLRQAPELQRRLRLVERGLADAAA